MVEKIGRPAVTCGAPLGFGVCRLLISTMYRDFCGRESTNLYIFPSWQICSSTKLTLDRKWELSLALVRLPTYIGVDPGVARSKGTVFVQQDAAVSRALILLLLLFFTPRDGGVGLLITPVRHTDSHLKKLCVLVSFLSVLLYYLT